jgi:ABC-type phosphate transport system permease subunit
VLDDRQAEARATGVLLAVARISGETAPLLFTALNNQFFSSNLGGHVETDGHGGHLFWLGIDDPDSRDRL